jgi:hypothetical protein
MGFGFASTHPTNRLSTDALLQKASNLSGGKISNPRAKNLPDNAPASIHEGRFMRRLEVRIGGGGRARVQHAHPKSGG